MVLPSSVARTTPAKYTAAPISCDISRCATSFASSSGSVVIVSSRFIGNPHPGPLPFLKGEGEKLGRATLETEENHQTAKDPLPGGKLWLSSDLLPLPSTGRGPG